MNNGQASERGHYLDDEGGCYRGDRGEEGPLGVETADRGGHDPARTWRCAVIDC